MGGETHDLPIFARQPDMEGDTDAGTRMAGFAAADVGAPGSGPKSLVGTRLSERLNEIDAPPSAVKFRGRTDFRPGDIYPESLLRYLCMCTECGFKINERIACCMRCELEHRITVMESAVKFSRSGFYLDVRHTDRVEFSLGALKLFETGDVGSVAALRRPPMFPSRSDLLAMKSA